MQNDNLRIGNDLFIMYNIPTVSANQSWIHILYCLATTELDLLILKETFFGAFAVKCMYLGYQTSDNLISKICLISKHFSYFFSFLKYLLFLQYCSSVSLCKNQAVGETWNDKTNRFDSLIWLFALSDNCQKLNSSIEKFLSKYSDAEIKWWSFQIEKAHPSEIILSITRKRCFKVMCTGIFNLFVIMLNGKAKIDVLFCIYIFRKLLEFDLTVWK